MSTTELPSAVKRKIEETFGAPVRYPADCERLALDIRNRINETIGVTTLKRLFGFADDVLNTRISTLDLLARYVGHYTYSDLLEQICPTGDSDFEEAPDIDIKQLKKGDIITFEYLPDRKVSIQYLGNDCFKVTASEKSSLIPGDIIVAFSFTLHHPLRIRSVIRNGKDLGGYVAGKVSGLTSLVLASGN